MDSGLSNRIEFEAHSRSSIQPVPRNLLIAYVPENNVAHSLSATSARSEPELALCLLTLIARCSSVGSWATVRMARAVVAVCWPALTFQLAFRSP